MTEYDSLKAQRDAILARQRAVANAPIVRMLERVADFDFMATLDATPTPVAREAYTRLMVDIRLMLREFQSPAPHEARKEGEQ